MAKKFKLIFNFFNRYAELRPPINIVWKAIEKEAKFRNEMSILDIGFGQGAHWKISEFPSGINVTSLDANDDLLDCSDSINVKTKINDIVPSGLNKIKDKSFDFVIAFDLIEHLPIHDGHILIYEMERIAKKEIFIFTPNGFVRQPPDEKNVYNRHVSGWKKTDFTKHEFSKHFGSVGLRICYGAYAQRKSWVEKNIFTLMLVTILNRIALFVPVLAFSILHSKKIYSEKIPTSFPDRY